MQHVQIVSPPGAAMPRLRMANIIAVSDAEKQAMLNPSARLIEEQAEPARRILTNLKRLSPGIAACLDVKPPINEGLPFRLVRIDVTALKPFKSFIALSYQWLQDDSVIPQARWPTRLPIDPDMFQAVLEELEEGEGLWCDQICIDQRNETDKGRIVENMDTIYRAARSTVVVLGDDVILSSEEAKFLLEDIMPSFKEHPYFTSEFTPISDFWATYLRERSVFAQCVSKVLHSSWFERAWCSHEMRVARQQVFLVRCWKSDGSGKLQILRMTSEMFLHMITICVCNIEIVEHMEGFDTRRVEFLDFMGRKVLGILFRADQLRNSDGWKRSPQMLLYWKNQHRNLLLATNADEIFSLKAGGNPIFAESHRRRRIDAYMDLISIVLNVSEYAVCCRRSALVDRLMIAIQGVDDELIENALRRECSEVIVTFALAAGDPVALCTPFGSLKATKDNMSWICWPEDIGKKIEVAQYTTMPENSVTSLDEHNRFITLPLWQLTACAERLDVRDGSSYHMVADIFMQECYDKDINNSQDMQISRYLSRLPPDHPDYDVGRRYRDLYEQLVACCLRCGMSWVIQLASRDVHIQYPVSDSLEKLFWCINHIDTYGYQPGRYQNLLDDAVRIRSAYSFLRFINQIIWAGLFYARSSDALTKEPLLLRLEGGKHIFTFVPKQETSGRRYELAIPVGLVDANYWSLLRMWILKPKEEDGPKSQHEAFVVVYKTCAFGDLPYGKATDIPRGQKVTWDVYGE